MCKWTATDSSHTGDRYGGDRVAPDLSNIRPLLYCDLCHRCDYISRINKCSNNDRYVIMNHDKNAADGNRRWTGLEYSSRGGEGEGKWTNSICTRYESELQCESKKSSPPITFCDIFTCGEPV